MIGYAHIVSPANAIAASLRGRAKSFGQLSQAPAHRSRLSEARTSSCDCPKYRTHPAAIVNLRRVAWSLRTLTLNVPGLGWDEDVISTRHCHALRARASVLLGHTAASPAKGLSSYFQEDPWAVTL